MDFKTRRLPWVLLPCVLLTLSGVTVLAPRRAAQAAPPAPAPNPAPQAAAYDDGDGDELLEHWSDAKYSGEARLQIAVIAGLLTPLAVLSRRRRRAQPDAAQEINTPGEATELRKAA